MVKKIPKIKKKIFKKITFFQKILSFRTIFFYQLKIGDGPIVGVFRRQNSVFYALFRICNYWGWFNFCNILKILRCIYKKKFFFYLS